MFVEFEHPVAGKTTLTGSHIKLGPTPARIAAPNARSMRAPMNSRALILRRIDIPSQIVTAGRRLDLHAAPADLDSIRERADAAWAARSMSDRV